MFLANFMHFYEICPGARNENTTILRTLGSWGYWDVDAFDGTMTPRSDLWAVGVTALWAVGANLADFAECGPKPTDPRSWRRELRAGLAKKTAEECGLLRLGSLRTFLLAVLDATKRPSSGSELVALLPDPAMPPRAR